jgi:hypothetical protein
MATVRLVMAVNVRHRVGAGQLAVRLTERSVRNDPHPEATAAEQAM